MKLLTIRDVNENAAIYKFIRNANRGTTYWTAGAKLIDNKNWVWMSYGSNVDYTKWAPGQPDNNDEQCIAVNSADEDLSWHDVPCGMQNFFICERYEPRTFSQNKDMTYSRWQNLMNTYSNVAVLHYNNKIYYFSRYFKTNYMQAIQFCKILNMELVAIESKEENDRISKYIRDTNAGDDWWSSGSRLLDGKNWVWFTRGIPVEFTNWRQGEPNGEEELCLHLAHNQDKGLEWTDDYCHNQFKVICESGFGDDTDENIGASIGSGRNILNQGNNQGLLIPIDIRNGGSDDSSRNNPNEIPTPQTTTRNVPIRGYSDVEWDRIIRRSNPGIISIRTYGGKHYHVEISLIGTQRQAAMYCTYHNMQLVEINNQNENGLLERLLLDTGATGPYWTAGQRQAGSWMWSISKQPVTYTNWNLNNPSVGGWLAQDCIQVDERAKWSNDNCDKRLFFVCEAQMQNPVVANGQCSQPVVNVYIKTNLVTDEGEKTLRKEILSSKSVSTNDGVYQVQVINNIDVNKKEDDAVTNFGI